MRSSSLLLALFLVPVAACSSEETSLGEVAAGGFGAPGHGDAGQGAAGAASHGGGAGASGGGGPAGSAGGSGHGGSGGKAAGPGGSSGSAGGVMAGGSTGGPAGGGPPGPGGGGAVSPGECKAAVGITIPHIAPDQPKTSTITWDDTTLGGSQGAPFPDHHGAVCGDASGGDAAFTVTVNNPGTLTFSLSAKGSLFDPILSIDPTAGCTWVSTPETGGLCANDTGPGGAEAITVPVVAGQTVWGYIDSPAAYPGAFLLKITFTVE